VKSLESGEIVDEIKLKSEDKIEFIRNIPEAARYDYNDFT
jgi:hypothetical protein